MKLWLFPHHQSSLCLSVTKPETANPLALRVHGHLEVPGKSRITFILMTRSQVSTKSLPVLTNAAGASSLQHKMVTPPVPVAILQAARPDPGPVPGVRDANRSVTRSVPVTTPPDRPPLNTTAASPDPPVPVPGVEEATPQAPMPHARPVPVPCARLLPVVAL
ncbi:proline-rich receptor-like protein kinase PERK8 [Electrophorus electricus]|uniref:proline-rich receptor-like protein kinase PERK8 n=1 Tax=Electrophorus electricus TaxID=8005 RepID=UPI0015CFFF6E|nr:proline-rich receptor-like protein kinase PERK8 [Electrophorus electricus]